MKNKKLVLAWILLVLWMVFIFYMSSCNGNVSSDQSETIAYVLHNILGINYSDKLIFIIRKCAHVFILFHLLFMFYMRVVMNFINYLFL